jgi:ABC-type Mn2+/Zn2+ transport system permease subunit/Mn-dependent DtxR family transcriptional regulator
MSTLQSLLLDPLQYAFMQRALVASVLVGVVCGVLGCYIVLRRMALIGDALSHAVLPGVAIAFIIGADFFLGAVSAGIVTAVLIGWVTANSRVKEDAAIGVVFTGAFALGIVLITLIQSRSVDLFHMLFGNVLGVDDRDLLATALITGVVLVTIAATFKELLLHAFDPTMAAAIGLPRKGLHYLLMVLLSLTVVASLQTVGLVLVVAMLITPASTAYLLTDRFSRMLTISAVVGVISAVVGLYASYYWNVSSGAAIVLVATLLFFVAMLFAPKRGLVLRWWRTRRSAGRTATEDALKHLYALTLEDAPAGAPELAARLGVSERLARRRLNALRRQGLADRDGLTTPGREQARDLVRAHRLWERYLVDKGVATWSEVHAEAERLEHLEPRRMADRLDLALGSPQADPHGQPIPGRDRDPETILGRPLASLVPGEQTRIVAVRAESAEALRQLADLGLTPATRLEMLEPLNGEDALRVRTNGGERTLPRTLAEVVLVSPAPQG